MRFAIVKAAETSLTTSSIRGSSSRVETLLASDFAEIGRSGRRWTRDDTVHALAAEESHDSPETSEWLFNEVAPDLVLVTYRAHTSTRDSRHSSLWDLTSSQPALRFHQGTVIPPDAELSE